MAKSKKIRRVAPSYTYQGRRDLFPVANDPWDVAGTSTPLDPVDMLQVEDRRTFHPAPASRPFRALSTRLASWRVFDPVRPLIPRQGPRGKGWSQTRAIFRFTHPNGVAVCVRRGQRREVLHALGRTGAGGPRSHRPPRRSASSSISCRKPRR